MGAHAAPALLQRDGPECLEGFDWIDDQARERLSVFADCLRRWNGTHNLVSAATLNQLWIRHVADSLQLVPHRPPAARRWIDLGSGGGFPGLVIAIALAGAVEMTLVEANRKKAAFLRAGAREAGVDVLVVAERIESFAKTADESYDVISARGLAPFADILSLAFPLAGADTRFLLLKGQDFVNEAEAAAKYWNCDLLTYGSVTDPNGRIVVANHVRRVATAGSDPARGGTAR